MAKRRWMEEEQLIDHFVAWRASTDCPGIRVESRPDKVTDGDIDAIAGPLAIEHTSLDMLRDQRTREGFFRQVFEPLRDLPAPTDYGVTLVIAHEELAVRREKNAVRKVFAAFLENEVPRLTTRGHSFTEVGGMPLHFIVFKSEHVRRRINVVVGLDGHREYDLAEYLRGHVPRKTDKLRRYASTHRTVLLLESDDLQLAHPATWGTALARAFPNGVAAKEVWLADTSVETTVHYWRFDGHGFVLRHEGACVRIAAER